MTRWRNYALSFHVEAMQAEKFWFPTYQQFEMCNILDKHRFLAIAAARGVGKTWFEAVEIFRHMICFRVPGLATKVLINGPTGGQMSDVIWAEVSAAHEHLLPWLKDRFIINQDGMYCIENPTNWKAAPRAAKKEAPGAVQGQHGSTLNCYDEGSQIPDSIFDVSTSSHTQGHLARAICSGNPDRLKGYFFRIFNEMRGKKWYKYFIDALDCLETETKSYPYFTPDGEQKKISVRGLVSEEYIEDQKDSLGEGTPLYMAYVRGKFASSEVNQLIKQFWVKKAWSNTVIHAPDRKRIMGFDPGYEVDPSAYTVRKGNCIEEADEWQGQDPTISANLLAARFDELKAAGRPVDFMCIDTIGIGAGVYSNLYHRGYPVISVKASSKAPSGSGTECRRMRDWLWWQSRNFFRDFSPKFEEESEIMKKMADELVIPSYKFHLGKVVVQSKEELKNAGYKSPNLADSLNNTFRVDFSFSSSDRTVGSIDRYRRKKRALGKAQTWKVA